MKELRYKLLQKILKKEDIQRGKYPVQILLPSENELCKTYSITLTMVRKALDDIGVCP